MDEAGFLGEALKGLIASGPIAVLLAFGLRTVWNKYQDALDEIRDLNNKMLGVFLGLNGESHDGED